MDQQLLFFFYRLIIDINNTIGINIFLLPFYLYHDKAQYHVFIFSLISVLFVILFITCDKIQKNIFDNEQKTNSYFYFLSDYFYYIELLCFININIFYINKIINLYNNLTLFYNAIAITILLFLFILIKNNTSNINKFIIAIKSIVFIPLIYLFNKIPNYDIAKTISHFQPNTICELIPIFFFSFLGNNEVFHIITQESPEEKSNNDKNKINNIKIITNFIVITFIYKLLYQKKGGVVLNNILLLNTTLSEIVLKQNKHNNIIHILNILIILLSFLNIHNITLKCQKIINKIIQKTNPDKPLPENIILFFVLFSIIMGSKMIMSQEKNIMLAVFFSTLSFFNYIIHYFKCIVFNLNTLLIIISLLFIIIINIISSYQLIYLI
jgi:hypothetical protein